MEWISTKVVTQYESFVPDQYQPNGGPKELEIHVDVKTTLRHHRSSIEKNFLSPVKWAQTQPAQPHQQVGV